MNALFQCIYLYKTFTKYSVNALRNTKTSVVASQYSAQVNVVHLYIENVNSHLPYVG